MMRWLRYLPIALLVCLLVALGYLIAPRRTADVVTMDGQHRWQKSNAPPRRSIVWRPAQPLAAPAADFTRDAHFIRPQLAAGGSLLYFTVRAGDGTADIYRSRLQDGQWGPAEAVVELNSAADDVGPAISADGRELYFSSNRPGGQGGFDIYVSRRQEGGWGPPRNLGPQINTPTHDQDPAVTPNGRLLFFASNRTRPGRPVAAADDSSQAWSATMRAELGRQQFDLFVAQRQESNRQWKRPQPLRGANTAYSEGEPFVGPWGVYLYFASNRPNASGEAINFDLYRSRLDGDRIRDVETLGGGVNTAANEHEPALSPEGFRIVFSSDRSVAGPPQDRQVYALYGSTAAETYEQVAWDTSRLSGLLAVLAENGWWLALAALLLALVAALVWYLRQVSLRRAPVPAFFLIALVVHLLLGVGSFFVYFGSDIARQIEEAFEDVLVAANLHQSHETGQEAYEKVADLKSVEAVKPADIARQVTEVPSMPVPTESSIPSVPTKVAPETPLVQAAEAPPVKTRSLEQPELTRRRPRTPAEAVPEQVETEQPQAVVQSTPGEMSRPDVEIPPVPQTAQPEVPLERRSLDAPLQLVRDAVPAPAAAERTAPASNANPTLQRQAIQIAATPSPRVQMFAPSEVAQPVADQPSRLDVPVARRQTSPPAASPAMPPRRAAVAAPQVPVASDDAPAPAAADVPRPVEQQPTLDRARSLVIAAEPPRASAGPMTAPQPATAQQQLAKMSVDVGRRAGAAPSEAVAALPKATPTQLAINLQVSESPETIQQLPDVVRASSVENPLVAKRGREFDDEEAIELQAAPGAETAPAAEMLAAQPVDLRRRTDVSLPQPAGAPRRVAVETDVPTFETGSLEQAAEPAAPHVPALAAAEFAQPETPRVARQPTSDQAALDAPPMAAEVPQEAARQPLALRVDRRDEPAADLDGGSLQLRPGDRGLSVSAIQPTEVVPNRTPPAPQPTAATVALAKSQAVEDTGAAERIEMETSPAPSPPGEETPVASVAVDFVRPELPVLEFDVQTPDEFGGTFKRRQPKLVIGSLAQEAVEAAPSFSELATRVVRRPARAPLLLYAEDSIGLQAMLRLRGADMDVKKDLVQAFGGSDKTLQAVRQGLTWIEVHQHQDGHWSLHQFGQLCNGHNCTGHGSAASDTAATGLALLPFLGDGHTHTAGKHMACVKKGLDWLVANQRDNGDLFTGGQGNAQMYSHGIAAIALCEAYGMSKDPALRDPAQAAVDFIVAAQHDAGGWRYTPKQPGDTSVVGWQIMALKSAQMAGLNVPQETLNKTRNWLRGVEGRGASVGRFGYQNQSGSPAMTAEALLCLEYLGAARTDPSLQGGAEFLLSRLPQEGRDTSYYWYYGTQVMFHMQGVYWTKWNDAIRDLLVETQVTSGPMAGTWDPKDNWEKSGGRIYATSLRLLMLEVYYRHLPLYQVLDIE